MPGSASISSLLDEFRSTNVDESEALFGVAVVVLADFDPPVDFCGAAASANTNIGIKSHRIHFIYWVF